MDRRVRTLAIVLRAIGCLDLVALGAVVMPRHWMSEVHQWVGLGDLPAAPLVGYLARSASALYACTERCWCTSRTTSCGTGG